VAKEIMELIYRNKTETIEERHAAAMARAKKEATGYEPDDPRRGMWNKIASDLEQVDIGALKSEMRVDQVPVQFKKDAVTSSLRVLLNRAIDQDAPASKIDQISNAIREVKAKPRDYISKSDVIAILDPFTDERDKSFVLRNEEFVSSTDVRMFNPGNVAVEKGLTKLEDRSHMDHPGFAFKLGAENHREMLAGKLLQHMGMNQFVMPKLDVKFEKAKLGSEMSPEGIAGKWLEDAQDLDVKAWDKVGMAKRKLEEAKFKGEDTGQYERELSKAMEPFRELGGAESVQSHALIDLIFCSYDSHQLQYKHKNGQWHCFDFARFLAPFETFSSEGYTWATIRSAFLNDPRCDEAMEETLVDTIKGWDLEAMESDMRSSGLIGTEEEFAQAEKELSAILKDSVSLSGLSDDEAKAMCRKYGMAVGTDDTISDLKAKLASRLSERKAEIKKQTYPKVHPHAFDQMKARMNRLQRYVAESDSPTVTGAYERMYPQLSLFVKVLGRMEANPSLSISFKRDPSGNLMQRNLEMILSEAEDKKMATADEIAQMKEGLAELTANSPESLALATTMDLS
ncbi:MAG: hypothetical protein ACE5GN_05970, partial [Waddliaceae bacterium]